MTEGRQLFQVALLGLHELVVDLLQEQLLLLVGLEDEGAAVALAVLDCEGVLVVEVLLVLHDLAPVAEGDAAEHPGPVLAALLGHDQLGAEEVEGPLDHLPLHREQGGRLLEDELDPWLLDRVGEEEGPLDLADLVPVDDLVEFLVVGVVDVLEGAEDPLDVGEVGVVGGSVLFDLLHEQHVLGQALYGLDEVVLEGELVVLGVGPGLVDEVGEVLPLAEFVEEGVGEGKVVEVLEVEFEEVDLLLHLVEYDPVVRVVLGLVEYGGEKELIQLPDLVHVGKERPCLLPAYYLLLQQFALEIGYHQA